MQRPHRVEPTPTAEFGWQSQLSPSPRSADGRGKTHSVPYGTIRKTKSNNDLKTLDESKTRAIGSVVLSTSVELTAGRGATYAAFPVFRLQGRLTSSTASGSRRRSSPRAPCSDCLARSIGVADRRRNTTMWPRRLRSSPLDSRARMYRRHGRRRRHQSPSPRTLRRTAHPRFSTNDPRPEQSRLFRQPGFHSPVLRQCPLCEARGGLDDRRQSSGEPDFVHM